MTDLLQAILSAQGGRAVEQMSQATGLGQEQTVSALQSLVPVLASGLAKNAQSGGLESLLGALASGRHARYVEDPDVLSAPETRLDGNAILGHILGSKDASRQVATQASAQTGIGVDALKSLLPLVASVAMGALSQQTRQGGNVLGASVAPGGNLLGMLTPLLDADRDGSVADDIVGMLGKFLR